MVKGKETAKVTVLRRESLSEMLTTILWNLTCIEPT